jgi:hypothetical protein
MGLDMYLYKKTYVGNSFNDEPHERTQVEVRLDGKTHPAIQPHRVSSIQESVAYWCKAYHINQWMMDNGTSSSDSPDFYELDLEQIQELVELCKAIIQGEKDPKVDLPTDTSFSDDEYDEDDEVEDEEDEEDKKEVSPYGQDYFNGCQETIDMLEPLLQEPESDSVFIYTVSY